MLYVKNSKDTAPMKMGRSEFEKVIGNPYVYLYCQEAQRAAQALEEAKQRGDESWTAWWEKELKEAKGKLEGIIFQGDMKDETNLGKTGTRNGNYIVSNGKVMIDIDHIDHEEMDRIVQTVQTVCEEDGTPFLLRVGFMAITPSGKGMRIVINGREGSTLVDDQHWVAQLLNVAIDECCKDYTRLSFAVPWSNVLYYEPNVLFAECKPYTEAERPIVHATAATNMPPQWTSSSYGIAQFSGWEEAEIIDELEQELGGAPQQGNRNNFVFYMARDLRHLYGNDTEAIYRAIPSYGLSEEERRQAIKSAVNRPMSTYVPRCIYRRRAC